MKGIIVVDMPECCKDCSFCRILITDNEACCIMTEDENDPECYKEIDNHHLSVPDWCPIRPMPKYRGDSQIQASSPMIGPMQCEYRRGWNDCIDSIVEGGE